MNLTPNTSYTFPSSPVKDRTSCTMNIKHINSNLLENYDSAINRIFFSDIRYLMTIQIPAY